MNSEYNCAASVLLWEMTNAGRFILAIALAKVKVLPAPVTPKRVWYLFPDKTDSDSSLIARGWSPQGLNSETNLKFSINLRLICDIEADIDGFHGMGEFSDGNDIHPAGGDIFYVLQSHPAGCL